MPRGTKRTTVVKKAPAKMKAGKSVVAFKKKVDTKKKPFVPYYGGFGGKMSNGKGWGGY